MGMEQIKNLISAGENPSSLTHSVRTAVAAMASLLAARLLLLPEPYWAPITTLMIMQSSLGSALPISAQRFAGTVIGAAAGALVVTYTSGNVLMFGMGVFVIGMLCTILRLERNAFRFASMTLAVIMLVTRDNSAWVMAVHRFVEVSVGIAIALMLTVLWPER